MSEPSPEPVPGEDLTIQAPPAEARGTSEQQPAEQETGDGVD
jgi:hypothetical protein